MMKTDRFRMNSSTLGGGGGGKFPWNGLLAGAVSVALTLGAVGSEDIHDGVVVWLRGDSDANGDGIIQATEVVDARSPVFSEAIRPYGWLDGTVSETAGDFCWTNDTVTVPYTRRTVPGARNYGFRQRVREANNGSMPNTIVLSETASRITSCSWSFHLRFKWAGDCISPKTSQQWLVNAASDGASSEGHGFKWSVQNDGKFVCWIGSTPFLSGVSANAVQIESNKWTDVVFVFNDGGTVDLSLMQEGGSFVAKSLTSRDVLYRPCPTGSFVIGNESKVEKWGYYVDSAACFSAFRGQVNQFAVWNRALSADEVKRVLAWPNEDLVRAGVADGSASEFEGAEPVAEGALDADAGWGAFGGDIPAGASKSVAFVVPTRFDGLPQLLRWRGASDSASGLLELTANGTSVGVLAAEPDRWTVFLIPGAHFVAGETTTLTLTRVDAGTGPLRTDALAVGGSWQEGTVSGNQWENGSIDKTPVDYYVPDGDFGHFRNKAQQGSGMRLKFDVPESVAGFHKYEVAFSSVFEQARENVKFVAYVNGVQAYAEERISGGWQNRSFKVPRNLLKAGENELYFANEGDPNGAEGFFSFDYVQMRVGKRQKGICIVIR